MCDASAGGPFNRLILQTETGKEWEGEMEDEEEGMGGTMDVVGDENQHNPHHTAALEDQWLLYCHETQLAAG